ncbi:MAG: hypothetical protein P1U57_01390 [Oleibacter sp.]|nr:hypothetical protein [Thalassolituus sp.]
MSTDSTSETVHYQPAPISGSHAVPGMGRWGELKLSLRLLVREARSGELTLLLMALVLAITVSTGISLFSSRLELAMQANANDILGADLRVRSSTALPDEWLTQADKLDLTRARTLTFPSVVLSESPGNESMSLAAIKAVDDGYPLRGQLLVTDSTDVPGTDRSQGPSVGEAWIEPRLLALLNTQIGERISVGENSLLISGVVEQESDRGGNFYNLSPRVMVHWNDVADSGLLGPGSRVTYRLLLEGSADELEQFKAQLNLDPNQKFESLDDGSRAMSTSLERAKQYLSLAAMMAVVLASVAVAISVRRYARRHFDISALMRTFGLQQGQIFRIYTWQLFWVGILAAILGAALAWFLQVALLSILADLVPDGLPPASILAWAVGLCSGFVSLLGFGLPHILPLARISPLRVLRQELQPVPLSGWVLYAFSLATLTGLLWVFTSDALLSLGVMLGGSATLLVLLGLLRGVIVIIDKVLRQRQLSLAWRFAWQHIQRDQTAAAGQVLAFSLTLMVMLVIGMLRSDLLADWQRSLPTDTPNVFAMNIQPFDRESLLSSMSEEGIEPEDLYPIVPMRLTSVNGTEISELEIRDEGSIDRDLITSSANFLPDNNEVVAGDWAKTQAGPNYVSLEVDLAERLGFKLGDILGFRAAGVDFTVEINSLRSVDWASMTPNFYMMLSPDVMASLPNSYLTSFYLPDNQDASLTRLIKEFPGVTFLDTRFLITQLQSLLQRITLAIELILVCVLAGALLVMLSVLLTSTRERLTQGALLRTLGASKQQIRRSQWVEFGLLGGLAAIFALLGAEALCAGLYLGLLDIPYGGLGWNWLVLPPVTILLIGGVGTLMLRSTISQPPLQVLRE